MDDIRDISNSTGSEQNSSNTQQNNGSQPNMYGQYGGYGQRNQYDQYGGYGQRPDPLEDNHPVIPVKQKKKVSLAAIILVIIVLVVFAVMMITLAPTYSAARKYGKALVKGESVDKLSEMVFPEKLVKNGGEVYDSYKGVVQDGLDEIESLGDAKFKGVKLGKKIKSGDLSDIEKYYNIICKFASLDVNVEIEKGYECEIRFSAGGSNYYQKCCIVKMKGEGWKVFPGSLSELQTAMIMLDRVQDLDF